MNKIIEITPKFKSYLEIVFNDGYKAEIDFEPFIDKGLSEPLTDFDYFKKAFIDNNGGISWPNGYDFCPNFLRQLADKKQAIMR